MKGHVHEVVPAGAKAEELNIQHMREPCQRMPVARMADIGECPFQSLPADSGEDLPVLGNVTVVIEAEERIAAKRQEEAACHDCQETGHHDGLTAHTLMIFLHETLRTDSPISKYSTFSQSSNVRPTRWLPYEPSCPVAPSRPSRSILQHKAGAAQFLGFTTPHYLCFTSNIPPDRRAPIVR